jgi:hypothetical protein
MGYKLYASMGTGDFYAEHGLNVSETSFFHQITSATILLTSNHVFN